MLYAVSNRNCGDAWLPVGLRKFARFVLGVWRASVVGKISVVLVSAICVAALLYVAYLLLFGG